jgi:cation:H+ antiporter
MWMEFVFAGLGLIILLFAGDVLVKGAVNLSLRLGIPAMIVSLTVVAFGTSAPELLISISAILDDVPGLALGNVVGSNTANILLVLGIPAMISGLDTRLCETRRTYSFMIGGTILFVGFCFTGQLVWWHGLILLAALTIVLGDAARSAHCHVKNGAAEVATSEEEVEGADPSMRWWRIVFYLALGIIGLPLGANLLVDSSIVIARAYGVEETVIGLTLVAIGTSLPELATTVMAALRRHTEIALGNVIGSNLFNLLGIIGIATLVGPIPVDRSFLVFDLWVMLAASLMIVPFVFFKMVMTRWVGVGFAALYLVYIFVVLN